MLLLDRILRIAPILLLVVAPAIGGESVDADLVIRDPVIIDTRTGRRIRNRTVVVRGDSISEVLPTEEASDYAAATVIDGRGYFVIPALTDAHVHLRDPAELDAYLRYGIGLVINMSGSRLQLDLRCLASGQNRRRRNARDSCRGSLEAASGERAGPHILTTGPTLDGTNATNPLFTSATAANAADVVAWLADEGYDAVKVYQQIDPNTLKAVIEAADAAEMLTTGHVSRYAGIAGSLQAGLRYVAHGEELSFEYFDQNDRRYDRSAIPALAAMLARTGVTVTPMLNYLENIPRQVLDPDRYLATEPMGLVPAAIRQSFGPRQGWFANRADPEAFAEQTTDLARFVATLTESMQDSGVELVLGTDAGFGGAVPGYSVHAELQSLVRAGLTHLQALQTATLNAGRYADRMRPGGRPRGLVRPGYRADLLLLREDPLVDIAATLAIEGVLLSGRWHGAEDLATIDRALRDRQRRLLPLARRLEAAIVAGDVAQARSALEARPPAFDEALLITPDNCVFLGYRHYYGGRRALAGRLYEVCAEMSPDDAPLWIHIARAREHEGDPTGALEAYSRALALNPWYGDPQAAIERLRQEGR